MLASKVGDCAIGQYAIPIFKKNVDNLSTHIYLMITEDGSISPKHVTFWMTTLKMARQLNACKFILNKNIVTEKP